MIETRENIPPAPKPWIMRAVMSITVELAPPHSPLPTAKRATARIMGHLRPKISAAWPYIGWTAAIPTKYPLITQMNSGPDLSSAMMVGRAVATTEVSRAARRTEKHNPGNTSQNCQPQDCSWVPFALDSIGIWPFSTALLLGARGIADIVECKGLLGLLQN
jgi:hypothetical protein